MRSIIIYYSYSGNTRKVAKVLIEFLQEKGSAEYLEIISPSESESFFGQARRAFRHTKAKIDPIKLDLSDYDLICLGTPVWAFGPAPAMNTYLDKCCGLGSKEVVLFTTYGSGLGNQRCLNYMQDVLAKKGARDFKKFSIQQFQVKDREFVLRTIKELTRL
jgi:flavodoxin